MRKRIVVLMEGSGNALTPHHRTSLKCYTDGTWQDASGDLSSTPIWDYGVGTRLAGIHADEVERAAGTQGDRSRLCDCPVAAAAPHWYSVGWQRSPALRSEPAWPAMLPKLLRSWFASISRRINCSCSASAVAPSPCECCRLCSGALDCPGRGQTCAVGFTSDWQRCGANRRSIRPTFPGADALPRTMGYGEVLRLHPPCSLLPPSSQPRRLQCSACLGTG